MQHCSNSRLAAALAGVLALATLSGCRLFRGDTGPRIAPPQQVDMDPEALRKFQQEVEEYVELHRELLERVPNVGPNATPEQIEAHRKKMTEAIRAERASARQGAIFKPPVAAAFRRIIAKELAEDRADIVQAVKEGNPKVEGVPDKANPTKETKKPFTVAVNAIYPEDAPLSSVPPSLLLKLPPLPEQVKYRFVGRDLILRDTEANVILDLIKDAVPDRSIPR